MKTFKVRASYRTYCSTTIEAKNEAEAYAIAQELDGGVFEPEFDLGDWHIDSCDEVEE